jgi:predicted NBD/HSP70 family sugar kinase
MEPQRTTARDIRRYNRSTVLTKLFFDGPLSRHELSRLTALSSATISNVTAELADERLVVEAGLADSGGGRPGVLLRVNPSYAYVIGIDVGDAGAKVELFDMSMARRAGADRPLPERPDPTTAAEAVAAGIREVLREAAVEEGAVLGVGIGLPGVVEQGDEVLVHAATIGWQGVPFARLVRGEGITLPLFLDNCAKTQGRGEMWFGAGRGYRQVVVALVGSGVGADIVIDGTTYSGATSSAGEWGHTTIVYGGRLCRCGSRGCLEAYVGAVGILDRYRQAVAGQAHAGAGEVASLEALIAAAERSRTAARLLDETAAYLGAGIANLINLFNPEQVVLGGWAGLALGARLLPRIREAARIHALAHPYQQTSIELCRLGPDAAAFGGATLPVAGLLARGGDPRGATSSSGSVLRYPVSNPYTPPGDLVPARMPTLPGRRRHREGRVRQRVEP